jgi:hypothetical protein
VSVDLQAAASNYRIVTNGRQYVVQRKHRFLWWRWWGPLIHGDSQTYIHDDITQAEHEMIVQIELEAHARDTWKPFETGNEYLKTFE